MILFSKFHTMINVDLLLITHLDLEHLNDCVPLTKHIKTNYTMNTKLFKLIYTFFGKIPYKLLVICTILLCINLCCKLYEH